MSFITVEVHSDEVIGDISTKDLKAELKSRSESDTVTNLAHADLYYALRDRDIDKAILAANSILDKTIGRTV